MDLEIAILDLRYEALRSRSAVRERRLLAALATVGQKVPIVVIRDEALHVVVDGYKRVRGLRRLGADLVSATVWDLTEVEALVLEWVLRDGVGSSALEQGWLLHELETRFGLGREELAQRFTRTPSWVSRRLGLVRELPESVQTHVRDGAIGSHAAMKHLVPLARANYADCARLADAVAPERLTTRQIAELCATYAASDAKTRELLVTNPKLALQARAEMLRSGGERTPVEHLIEDARVVMMVARRARARVVDGALDGASETERDEARRAAREAAAEVEIFTKRVEKEVRDAG